MTAFNHRVVAAFACTFFASALAWAQLPTPTAYYPFDEGAGAAGTITVDLSGNGNDGVVNGASFGWVPGHTGGAGDFAIDFTGGANRVNVQDGGLGGFAGNAVTNDTMSFSFWANQQGTIANSSIFWAHSPAAGANERGAQAHVPWGNGTIFFDTAGCCSDPSQRQTVGHPAIDSEWHHYAFVKDGVDKLIYYDGGLLDSQGSAAALLTFDELTIGAEGTNHANSFDGFIDDFAVFDVALTAQQVSDIANGQPILAVPEPASIAIWSLIGLGLAGFGCYRIRRKK